jgi:hypothetical protein
MPMHVGEERPDARVSEVTETKVGIDSWIWLYGELLETNRALQSGLMVNFGSSRPPVDEESIVEEVLLLEIQSQRLEKRLNFWSSRRNRRRQID